MKIAEGPPQDDGFRAFRAKREKTRPTVMLAGTAEQMHPSNKGDNPGLPPGFWDWDKKDQPKPDVIELLRNIAGD